VVVQCSVCAAASVEKKSGVTLVYEKTFRDRGSEFITTRNLKKSRLSLVTLRDNF